MGYARSHCLIKMAAEEQMRLRNRLRNQSAFIRIAEGEGWKGGAEGGGGDGEVVLR